MNKGKQNKKIIEEFIYNNISYIILLIKIY